MVTLTISAILLALAIPQMREYIERKRVSGAANELAGDVRYARAMVLQQNRHVWIKFGSTSDFTCYVLFMQDNMTGECDCTRTGTPMCGTGIYAPVAIRSVFIPRSTGITLTSTSVYVLFRQAVGEPFWFSGTGEVEVSGSAGGQLKIALSGLVKATICSLSGHTTEFGDCP